MTSTTPRLDSLAVEGTDGSLVRLRLADATVLAVNIWPGSDRVDCVRLIAPLEAPDNDADPWLYGDRVESWLTGGEFGDYEDHVDVPLPDLRDLMAAHGGEHADQTIPEPTTTAGEILCAALAGLDIPVHTDGMSPSYAIPRNETTPDQEVYTRPHLLVADRAPSIEHAADSHTGWVVTEHAADGQPVGDPLYIGGDGGPVDCATDSQAAADAINDWLADHQD